MQLQWSGEIDGADVNAFKMALALKEHPDVEFVEIYMADCDYCVSVGTKAEGNFHGTSTESFADAIKNACRTVVKHFQDKRAEQSQAKAKPQGDWLTEALKESASLYGRAREGAKPGEFSTACFGGVAMGKGVTYTYEEAANILNGDPRVIPLAGDPDMWYLLPEGLTFGGMMPGEPESEEVAADVDNGLTPEQLVGHVVRLATNANSATFGVEWFRHILQVDLGVNLKDDNAANEILKADPRVSPTIADGVWAILPGAKQAA